MKKRCQLYRLLAILLFWAVPCSGDVINIALTPAVLAGSPGSVLSFNGILTNTGQSTIFLNSAGINLTGPFSPADEDTTGFFTNAPLSLAGGSSTMNIALFTINISNPFAPGVYRGTFSVLGGSDENAQDIVGSASFSIQVNAPTNVPEPGPLTLLLTGCSLFFGYHVVSQQRTSSVPVHEIGENLR